jgi:hypothetical protein
VLGVRSEHRNDGKKKKRVMVHIKNILREKFSITQRMVSVRTTKKTRQATRSE